MAKITNIRQKQASRYCAFCVNKKTPIDYKNTDLLKRYISSFGKIVPSKRSGVCSEHQRKLSAEIKRSRIMALLPFVHK
ncbi:MAG: 30S ribosomal protein S18 [Candidatus Uhrbacteria bacterium GW2011_GWD2_41_121]|uniref:Small ribosomal subunit protein bS18 n=1 Tax=Candidatus Uhrbacteria bacterium GW2011_GWC1_41_20 TaxID=1618983 RepID=A0A0G0YBD8_9BACT|nr:MAG: 30S ribosomal protein S18 [Candidatus Uhrbacteria bacterium GW2011_GWE1_39_46]KKR63340.1 MAG: 30S ribosomal protein S18 [Candidatus Uhrbacteria bacterium GW2011_GWC2_40_450]KKR89601.1 MAG: 30S ribosomal protein S18 [Candidatus Uhrbacteria bacterium GW2011_GWD2_41_121]KKR95092.1 MAG: 30S ribosomal protein S18 [Candidatus Uhrbacteria bacterium GW2011_GWD1_41_16]KKR97602.1 MAG: 30S ribosomal protein S18 [Candidatus Uhrbacteria bacterium GW2011_GWC1_41_20]KKS05403.1 MAG: 30S ribosomal prot